MKKAALFPLAARHFFMNKFLSIPILLVILTSCASYYQRNIEFQTQFSNGEMDKAEKTLEGSKKMQKDRNRFLYLVNMGVVNHMQQEFERSNQFLNEADLMVEDYKTNYASEALSLISNPQVRPYRAEDFEPVMIHYYKALNYLNLGKYDAAIVEAKRMNLILNQLNDKHKDKKNRYQADAFAHIIIGLAYEASGQLNDAFIAYRNAYSIFIGEHGYFDIAVPEQLKQDLLRTTYLLGFRSEFEWYQREFDAQDYSFQPLSFGEAVIFWQNGLGPIKDEWSINFFTVPGQAGYVNFTNEELGLTFPFYIGDDNQKKNDLIALRVVRVAFPKYIERPTLYTNGWIELAGERYTLEKVVDINAIAFKTLQDRFLREMSSALLRLALKKASEIQLQQQNEALGALATITNAVTEKADTRNWQTLPHTIYYARVPLNEGDNEVLLKMKSKNDQTHRTSFNIQGKKGAFHFMPYQSLEHLPAASWDSNGGQYPITKNAVKD